MARRPPRELTIVLAIALVSACSSTAGSVVNPVKAAPTTPDVTASVESPASGTTPAPPAPSSNKPPGSTADDVALSAVRAWLSYDTLVDHRPNDTARRLALPWLAPPLRQQVLAFASDADPGADWGLWTRHRARAAVTTELGGDDHPPDTAASAWRQVTATVRLRGADGWTVDFQKIEFIQLVLVGDRWLVADLRTE